MGTSRTPHATAPAHVERPPYDHPVPSRQAGPRSRAHLRLVPDPPAGSVTPIRSAASVRSAAPAPAKRREPEVPVRRTAPKPPVSARPAPIRLTRRGRVVAVLFLAAALVGTGWSAGRAMAATTGDAAAPSVIARHGDTLWSIAVRTRPDADPRITVDRMIDANGLATPVLQPGQRVILPRS